MNLKPTLWLTGVCVYAGLIALGGEPVPSPALPRIAVSADGRGFVTSAGKPFVPFGLTYYRPGTGWAPQVWKKFDAEATRKDFARMKELGVTCVRVFLTFGSFYTEPGKLSEEGLAKFEQFLGIAEQAGIYVHPTGPDHWEGLPEWAKGDRYADEQVLAALESFWKQFAARFRGRTVLFAYDLLNEPEIGWQGPAMERKWNDWLKEKHGTAESLAKSWGRTNVPAEWGNLKPPVPNDTPGGRELLEYQVFRESIADEWTRRQVNAIKSVDKDVLVTVGFIQWSVPALLPGVRHYSGFRPERQAKFLDFLEVHFYPLANGAYEYRDDEQEKRNLAYLHSVVNEVARAGKPVVLAEFGWYGGGKPNFDGGKHPAATEEQQARWCRRAVETTGGLAVGWLNWGLFDQPEATDVSQLTGLLTTNGAVKAWGREFSRLVRENQGKALRSAARLDAPRLEWDLCRTSLTFGSQFRQKYYEWMGN